MIKHKERSDPRSCWNKAQENEPVFVLLGHDPAAAATIRSWVEHRIGLAENASNDPQILSNDPQIIEALALADTMEQYAALHPSLQDPGQDSP